MKFTLGLLVAVLFASSAGMVSSHAAPLQRVANTTLSSVPASPPGAIFTATNAFPGLVFTNPIGLYAPPGETNRLFVLEKRGRVIVITNLAAPTKATFLDLSDRVTGSDANVGAEEGLLGLAFHPGYATNGHFFVFYTGDDTTVSSGRHDILSRFSVNPANTNQGLAGSEVKLLRQRDEASNHNAGELVFGPDGYLYVSLGDEGGGDNSWSNAQLITKDYFSGILRLDVDKRPGSLAPNAHAAVTTNYAVPPDNPFVGATTFNGLAVNPSQVRTEFWAVGLRNPWRMSFDPPTGQFYCADVGQSQIEEVDLIVKGKNYGWAYYEGTLRRTNLAQIPAGFVNTTPLREFGRTNGFAVVGGFVYRGTRMAQLHGAYIYGDYGSGRIWALRQTNGVVTEHFQIMTDDSNGSGVSGLSAFGVDPSGGYLLYADEQNAVNGSIKRIVPATLTNQPPATLALVGAFSDLATLTPQAGVVPYDINLPFWSDHAFKARWFSVPNTNLDLTFARDANWSFPTGTVWIKHFEMELTNGVPDSRKRLETRFLVKTAGGGYGFTYRWTDPPTNALLVADEGLDDTLVINDGGNLRTQTWHYPSRTECLQCHTLNAGFALGFNTPQLNREFDYAGTVTNQVAALEAAGYFSAPVTNRHTLPALVHPTNELASLEARARSYLSANCAQCHQPGGTSQALWDARLTTATANAGLVNGALFNNLGNTNNRVLVPGAISNSVLLTRLAARGPGQMPPIGSTIADPQGVALIAAWITNDLPASQTFSDWQLAWFGSTNSAEAGPLADPDGDGANNRLEALTGTNPTNSLKAWEISIALSNGVPVVQFPQLANRGFEVQSTIGLLGAAWTPLDVPANAPFFSATNRDARVLDATTTSEFRYYRVRIFEP